MFSLSGALVAFSLTASVSVASALSVFILVGGTGDLAGKYLWDAVFREVYVKRRDDVRILASGRSEETVGEEKLAKIFDKLSCASKDYDDDDALECEENLRNFKSSVQYVQLDNDIQFAKFCKRAFEEALNVTEVLWYVATPPNYYPMVLMSVHSRCRYNAVPLKVALEKPFWRDASERTILNRIAGGRFTGKELYFVDHYLAKATVAALGEFKRLNRGWFDAKSLETMQLVLLEREHVKDTRLSFYDRYGVVRDVMQSHLTEVMLSLLADAPEDADDDEDALAAKRDVLQRLRAFSRSDWLSGQHSNYRKLTRGKSSTPTFAKLQFKFDVSPDSGVTREKSVFMISGKYMDAKRAYARLTFKDGAEAIFLFSAPVVLVSRAVEAKLRPPASWAIAAPSNDLCAKWLPRIFADSDKSCSDFITLTSDQSIVANTYRTVIDNFLNERKSGFTNMQLLEESWKLWDHVLRDFDEIQPKVYDVPEEMLNLAFPPKTVDRSEKVEL